MYLILHVAASSAKVSRLQFFDLCAWGQLKIAHGSDWNIKYAVPLPRTSFLGSFYSVLGILMRTSKEHSFKLKLHSKFVLWSIKRCLIAAVWTTSRYQLPTSVFHTTESWSILYDWTRRTSRYVMESLKDKDKNFSTLDHPYFFTYFGCSISFLFYVFSVLVITISHLL